MGKFLGKTGGHTLYDVQAASLVAFLVGELVEFAVAFDVEH